MGEFGYITFKSVSYAIKFEAAIKNLDMKLKMIPVPRSISSSCGMCIRFILNDLNELLSTIERENLEYEKIYTHL
ncbi:MAG: DUF3343 domain-containing protein [Tissierellia bacterium]|nr:DUF3343 domain-containing protein [Tissierellia bacterium]